MVAIVTPAMLNYKLKISGLVGNIGVVSREQGAAPQLGDTEPQTNQTITSSDAALSAPFEPAAERTVRSHR